MGGIGLIHPGFLAAGAALAAVPVLLHLLFRRKPPRLDLGTLRFLRLAVRDDARRRKVRRWLLLACRVAAVALLGLLFARPYRADPGLDGPGREVAILVDRSASMGAGPPGRTPLDRARAEASRILRSLPDGAEVHLALVDAAGVVPIPVERLDRAARIPSPAGTDHARGLDWARDLMARSRRKAREVHLLTDLQRVGLDRAVPKPFPPGVAVEVVDVGRAVRSNLAVEDARATRAEVRPGVPVVVSARVYNAGAFPARDVVARLELEGAGQAIQQVATISIPAGARREARFELADLAPGLYRGAVTLPGGDEMAFDDRRWLAFEARSPETILLVDGDPGATPYDAETYYLEAALRPRGAGSGDPASPYEPTRVAWDGGLGWPDLARVRLVVLANVPEVTPGVAASLRSFVEAGGRLAIFSGARLKPGALSSLGAAGLLPASVEGTVDGPIRFESWDAAHPLFGPFADPQHGDLRSLAFLRVTGLAPAAGSRVLATARDGRALVVESTVGRGRVLQLALAADNDRGDWATRRLYLPVIHQIVGYLTGRLPGLGPVRDLASDPANPPGVSGGEGPAIVRNVEAAESTPDRAALAEFRLALGLPEAARAATRPDEEAARLALVAGGSRRPGEFWRPVAWALLVVLVAETFVANRTPA